MSDRRLPFSEGTNVGRSQPTLFSDQPEASLQPQPSKTPGRMLARRGFDQGGAVGHGTPGFVTQGVKVNPTAEDWESAGPSQSKLEHTAQGAATKVHEGQFQMFMTPREIRSKYQGLEGDRLEAYDDRGGEMTKRPETTGGSANEMARSSARERMARWHGGASQIEDYKYTRRHDYGGHAESDDELFGRKLEESQMSPGEYNEVHGGDITQHSAPGWETLAKRPSAPSGVRDQAEGNYDPPPGMGQDTFNERMNEADEYMEQKQYEHEEERYSGASLYDKIAEQGVLSPIHLSYAQLGHTYGKQQVVGGHHRLAASEDIDPDQPIPVKHWRDIYEARASGTYS